jgi:uncharacterized protein (DUF1330 family)
MPAYVFSQVTIMDNDKYQQEFLPAVLKSHEAYGVKYVARTGDVEALEGHAPMRCVILEFQDIAHGHAWHQSPEFLHAREIGHSCLADVTVLLITWVRAGGAGC